MAVLGDVHFHKWCAQILHTGSLSSMPRRHLIPNKSDSESITLPPNLLVFLYSLPWGVALPSI